MAGGLREHDRSARVMPPKAPIQAKVASSNAADDVSSVAVASEELLASIEEISRQVVQSTTVVKRAVSESIETSTRHRAACRRPPAVSATW